MVPVCLIGKHGLREGGPVSTLSAGAPWPTCEHPGRALGGGRSLGPALRAAHSRLSLYPCVKPGRQAVLLPLWQGRELVSGSLSDMSRCPAIEDHGTLRDSDPLLISSVCCLKEEEARLPRPPASASSVASSPSSCPGKDDAVPVSGLLDPEQLTPAQRPDGRRTQETPGPSTSHC